MERKLAHVELISNIEQIPNADNIELATVLGWKVVIKKGIHKIGDRIVYFEIDSVLPKRSWNQFLFTDDRLMYRLKTGKFRGQISQGLVVGIKDIASLDYTEHNKALQLELGYDLTDILGISHYEPTIPPSLKGIVKGNFPTFLRKTDAERLQSYPDLLAEIRGIPLYISTKMDGTSFTAYKFNGVFGVCSRNLDLKDGENIYWNMAKKLDLPAKLPDGLAIQGELCGPGIQKNRLNLVENNLYVFNVYNISEGTYYNFEEFYKFCTDNNLTPVPCRQLGMNPFKDIEAWLKYAESFSYASGLSAEGIVIRPLIERYSSSLKGRLSFKVISNKYLIENGD